MYIQLLAVCKGKAALPHLVLVIEYIFSLEKIEEEIKYLTKQAALQPVTYVQGAIATLSSSSKVR